MYHWWLDSVNTCVNNAIKQIDISLSNTTVGLSGCVTLEGDFHYTILYIFHIDSLRNTYNSLIYV